MPSSALFARTTIAAAFQRTRLLMRRSMSGLPGIERLLVGGDGVDVGRVGGERQLDAVLPGVDRQLAKQAGDLCGAAALEHIIERVEPLSRSISAASFGAVLRMSPQKPRCRNVLLLIRRSFMNLIRLILTCTVLHEWPSWLRCMRQSCRASGALDSRSYCLRVAQEKKRAYRDDTYWGRPVPGFGDPDARLLLVALAPAAHGANRTGRAFTGDGAGGSGDFLMSALHRTGFANMPTSTARARRLALSDA